MRKEGHVRTVEFGEAISLCKEAYRTPPQEVVTFQDDEPCGLMFDVILDIRNLRNLITESLLIFIMGN